MLRRKDELTYTAGILARKLGCSRSKVKSFLKSSGLEKKCYRDHNNYLKIPASVAAEFVPAENLALQLKHKDSKKKRKKIDDTPDADFQDIISELGMSAYEEAPKRRPPKAQTPAEKLHAKMLELMRLAGLTTNDVLAFIEAQKKGAVDEETT